MIVQIMPDLNFYGNLLQAKQSQYDSNWKNLNNLYSSLYGAELTHKLNIEKKDELICTNPPSSYTAPPSLAIPWGC